MNTIIQCPTCNTKFALNASQLEGIESPKFHCSRCNTVFTPEDKTMTLEEAQVVEGDLNLSSETDSNFQPADTNDELISETEESELNDGEARNESEAENFITDDFEKSKREEFSVERSSAPQFPAVEFSAVEFSAGEFSAGEFQKETFSKETPENEESAEFKSITVDSLNEAEDSKEGKEWFLGNANSLSSTKTEKQLPLNYEAPEVEPEEEIKIDWPTNDGSKNYEVDFSSLYHAGDKSQDNNKLTASVDNFKTYSSSIRVPTSSQDLKATNVYNRKEAKSLLASLLGEEDDAELEENLESTPDAKGEKEAPKNDYYPVPVESKSELPIIEKNELNNSNVANQPTLAMSGSTPLKEHQNRSLKETTVLERSSLAFSSIDNDQNEEDKDFKRGYEKQGGNAFPEMDFSSAPAINRDNQSLLSPKKSKKVYLSKISFAQPILGYLTAWSVPLVFLFGLWAFSSSLHINDTKNYEAFSRSMLSALNLDELPSEILPPNELAISKLSGDIIKVDEDRKFVLAKGNVLNMSSKDYSLVRIEARLYNRNQIEIAKEVAAAPNKLNESAIKTDPIENLRELQNTYIEGSETLNQKTITPFTMVLDASDLQGELAPKFFGVRVYSIRNI